LRYFGPPLSASVRSGRRRPMNPSTSPWWTTGNITRSRNRSIGRPVLAVVATPVANISASLTPRWRRWSTRLVHPAGACPGRKCSCPARSIPNRPVR
jgi:hypothetical protein